MSDDTQPIAVRDRHGSGMHEKVAGLERSMQGQLDRIERALERSLGELREVDRHIVALKATIEYMGRRIDEVRADHDRRLDNAAREHGELVERVVQLERATVPREELSKVEGRVGQLEQISAATAPEKHGITVRGAATIGGAGAFGAAVIKFLEWLTSLGGGV